MSIAVKLIISGICLVVPGDEKQATRVTCPNATSGAVASSGAPIPPHFPYLIVNESNLVDPKQATTATFRMGARGEQLVWILDSASIALKEMPKGTVKTHPSLAHAAPDLAQIWPKKGKIRAEYWDVAGHPEKVAARLDITSGDVSAGAPGPIIWEFKPKQTQTPVVQQSSQEIVAKLQLPSATLEIRNYGHAAKYERLQIALKSVDGQPVDVSTGNAPLNDVLLLPSASHQHHATMHDFELFYRMFNGAPEKPPIPNAKSVSGKARAAGETCIPAICTDC